MIALSPGVAQSCFDLLSIVTSNSILFEQLRTYTRVAGFPAAQLIETAQALRWLRADDAGRAVLTPSGARLIGLPTYESRTRQALLDYVDAEQPAWINSAHYGRRRVLAFVRSELVQLFVEANLVEGTEREVVDFWDRLSSRSRGQRNDRLTNIGRRGERLSFDYEYNRTGRLARWVALDDNEDGYDILSTLGAETDAPLSIEVKTSTRDVEQVLYLTRGEWDYATGCKHHLFHLWILEEGRKPLLAAVPPADMSAHVPKDKGDGKWDVALIGMEPFAKRFQAVEVASV